MYLFSAAILAIALFLQLRVASATALLFLIGAGLGIAFLHSGFGFASGWRRFIVDSDSLGVRSNLGLLIIASVLFFPIVGGAFDFLRVSAASGPISVAVFFGAFLFGIGMQLGGGCGSGTLRAFGQGQSEMPVTLLFFIVGSTIGSIHLGWWLELPNIGAVSLIGAGGWLPALLVQLLILAGLYLVIRKADVAVNGRARPLLAASQTDPLARRLIHGPWSLWWGITCIALLSLLTLLVTGHPWSITFAFGLWGAKLWSALGGDVSAWAYWREGYPAEALQQSVLADTTSVMNFGMILGAALAASCAAKFALPASLTFRKAFSAMIGGLLLGYGARLGFGCNIGALFSGIATGSLHGWLWLAAAFLGNILGVQLQQRLDPGFGRQTS